MMPVVVAWRRVTTTMTNQSLERHAASSPILRRASGKPQSERLINPTPLPKRRLLERLFAVDAIKDYRRPIFNTPPPQSDVSIDSLDSVLSYLPCRRLHYSLSFLVPGRIRAAARYCCMCNFCIECNAILHALMHFSSLACHATRRLIE